MSFTIRIIPRIKIRRTVDCGDWITIPWNARTWYQCYPFGWRSFWNVNFDARIVYLNESDKTDLYNETRVLFFVLGRWNIRFCWFVGRSEKSSMYPNVVFKNALKMN